jgi:hypothetical protein
MLSQEARPLLALADVRDIARIRLDANRLESISSPRIARNEPSLRERRKADGVAKPCR